MERELNLDIKNPLHLYALHLAFMDEMNSALDTFTGSWNNHQIRTTGESPREMFFLGKRQQLLKTQGVNYKGRRGLYGLVAMSRLPADIFLTAALKQVPDSYC
jgi:hypothetical protein